MGGGGLDASLTAMIDRLIANKSYPKYQFERASEVFFAPFIEEWLGDQLSCDMSLVAMEFPLKKEQNNQSTNADYLLYSDEPRWWLVEMKTDLNSLRSTQVCAYRAALNSGKSFDQFVDEVATKIRGNSRKKAKYDSLLASLQSVDGRDFDAPLGVAFITPDVERPQVLDDQIWWGSLLSMLDSFEPKQHQELWEHVKRLKAAF